MYVYVYDVSVYRNTYILCTTVRWQRDTNSNRRKIRTGRRSNPGTLPRRHEFPCTNGAGHLTVWATRPLTKNLKSKRHSLYDPRKGSVPGTVLLMMSTLCDMRDPLILTSGDMRLFDLDILWHMEPTGPPFFNICSPLIPWHMGPTDFHSMTYVAHCSRHSVKYEAQGSLLLYDIWVHLSLHSVTYGAYWSPHLMTYGVHWYLHLMTYGVHWSLYFLYMGPTELSISWHTEPTNYMWDPVISTFYEKWSPLNHEWRTDHGAPLPCSSVVNPDPSPPLEARSRVVGRRRTQAITHSGFLLHIKLAP